MITMGLHSYCPKEDIDCYQYVNLTIGKWCSIGSGLKIYSGKHFCSVGDRQAVSSYPFAEQFGWDYPTGINDGEVHIGNDVWIATDVSILTGVTIGDGCVIGARSNVTHSIPPYAFVGGNPADLIHYRFNEYYVEELLKIAWWDWPDEKVREAMPYMTDVEKFVKRYG